jgi:hypothetical protein
MTARFILFGAIKPNQSASWFIHGFEKHEAVSFSIVVRPGSGARPPVAHAVLTQGDSYQHVDGTQAYKINIQNKAPFNWIWYDLLALVESWGLT